MIAKSINEIADYLNNTEGCLPSITEILHEFHALQMVWSDQGEFGQKYAGSELGIIDELFDSFSLRKRILVELGDEYALDGFTHRKGFKGRVHYAPLGNLLHISASNIALGLIDSMIMGVLSKNKNVVKYSDATEEIVFELQQSLEKHAPQIHSLVCFFKYKGGDKRVEKELFKLVDAVILWGGEDAIRSVKESLDYSKKLICHGPKISFHVITQKGLSELDYKQVVKDITSYNQQACSSSQNIYLEASIDKEHFLKELKKAWAYSREDLDPNEYVEFLKEKQLDLYQEFLGSTPGVFTDNMSASISAHNFPEPTALNGSVKIKTFKTLDELKISLSNFRFYLQSCGLETGPRERDQYAIALSRAGVSRFCRAGEMLEGTLGAPHDGEFNLMSLTTIISDSGEDEKNIFEGYSYASGGTTGEPKFSRYTYDEFFFTSKALGRSYQELGLRKGDKVGNLFAAGNMWSSFNAIQLALESFGAWQFPFGANIDATYFKTVVQKFGLKAVFGIPSLLKDLSTQTAGLKIEMVFYAGEALSISAKKQIQENWAVEKFVSAGYASVDSGPIGYQDPDGEVGEHILFDELVHLEIKNDQGYITSKLRETEPVVNYPCGDRIEILSQRDDGKIRFKLLGRADQKILIWSARIELSDIEKALARQNLYCDFQVQIKEDQNANEYLCLEIKEKIDRDRFLQDIYQIEDLKQTRSFDYVSRHLQFGGGNFLRNSRTGKSPKLLDLRN